MESKQITIEEIIAHQPAMYRMSLKIVKDQAVAEEIAHNSVIKAWEKRDTYDPSKSALSTWLIQITKNDSLFYYNRVKKENILMIDNYEDWDLPQEESEDNDPYVLFGVDPQKVDKLIREYFKQDPRMAEFYKDYYMDNGDRLKDIAAELGIGRVTLSTRFKRCGAYVRGKINDDRYVTPSVWSDKTASIIQTAADELRSEGIKLNVNNVSERSGYGNNTVYQYWSFKDGKIKDKTK
jgi:RNA polymerase sigma factor (sigma-70 family)